MAVAIYGQTGVGKTYNLFFGLRSRGRHPLLVRSLEDLSVFGKDSSYTDIIFDDISFVRARPELLIHLCDRDFPAPVRILHRSVTIPENIRKWFTHNSSDAWCPILATIEQQAAIDRRLTRIQVSSKEEVLEVVNTYRKI